MATGDRLNIKMLCYQYRDSHDPPTFIIEIPIGVHEIYLDNGTHYDAGA